MRRHWGKLLDFDFEAMPHTRLYQASDELVKHRAAIAKHIFSKVQRLFGLDETVTLYDLTNTYFKGKIESNPQAARGRSKEKRSDCPLVTLGVVLDGSGFVRRSRTFEGNVSEGATLEKIRTFHLTDVSGIADRVIATVYFPCENRFIIRGGMCRAR